MTNQGLKEKRTRELLPQGAEIVEGGVRYRVWAPDKGRAEVVVNERRSGKLTEMVPLLSLDARMVIFTAFIPADTRAIPTGSGSAATLCFPIPRHDGSRRESTGNRW